MGSSTTTTTASTWPLSWPGGSWEATVTVVALVVGSLIALTWLCLVVHTWCDVSRRTNNPAARAASLLLVAVFFLPGYWLYLAFRPADTVSDRYARSLSERLMLQELEEDNLCPECQARVREDFVVCPRCRASLKVRCRSCAQPIRPSWLACPFCTVAVDDGVRVLNAPQAGPPTPAAADVIESGPAAAYLGGVSAG
jgi:hypothetical protein